MKDQNHHKEEVIAKLKDKLAKVESGEIPVTVESAMSDPLCPPGYYYDKPSNSCILDVGP